MTDSRDRAREEFFSEAQELVESLGRDLLLLERAQVDGKVDPDLVNDIFRAVHTLKGLAGLFNAHRLATVSHELETLLDDVRLGRREVDAGVMDILFRAVELYGRLLTLEKEERDQPVPEMEMLIAAINGEPIEVPEQASLGEYELDPSLLSVLTEYEEHRLRTNIHEGLNLYRLRVQFSLATIDESLDNLKAIAKPHGEIITYLPTGSGTDADSIELDILMASSAAQPELASVFHAAGVVVDAIPRKAPSAEPRFPTPADIQHTSAGTYRPSSLNPATIFPPSKPEDTSLRSVSQTVRVDIERLDSLMNIVGELSIVRAALEQLAERVEATTPEREISAELIRLQRSFDRNLEAMQQGILEVRMVPLGQVFDKLARIARQLSREAGKSVNLVITGADTEVDKLIVEELSDPLMHMMRNAIDHGIETIDERLPVGKPETGTIALNAFQKGNHVVLEVEDDGRGIDAERLLAAALSRGLLPEDEARSLTKRDQLNLIFMPGLTTKRDITAVSGRGVGMDVVKTNIGRLGGVIDLQSEVGIGTKFTITLPITLAIISALIVEVGSQVFAIPLSNIQEAVVLSPENVRLVDGREVLDLRGSSLRLCHLADLFDLTRPPPESGPTRQYVVVAAVGASRLGLVVDRLIGGQDVVIKALGRSLANVRGFAGAADLGDQRLGLVIDTPSLIEELFTGERGIPLHHRGYDG